MEAGRAETQAQVGEEVVGHEDDAWSGWVGWMGGLRRRRWFV